MASPATPLARRVLPGPRHADQEHSLGDLRSQAGELLGALQELDDLLQLELRLVLPRHVDEGDALVRVEVPLCPALPEGEGLVAVALDLAEHEPDEEESDHPRKELDDHGKGRDGLRASGNLDILLAKGL